MAEVTVPSVRSTRRVRAFVPLVAGALAFVGLGLTSSPAGAKVDTVSGGAFGEYVNVTPLGLALINSGPLPVVTLPAGGGNVSNSVASVKVPPVLGTTLSAGVLDVHTEGATGETGYVASSASVANANALNGTLTATAISSSCRSDSSGSTGSTTLVGATLAGVGPLAVNPPPNTTINVAGLQVILNEQIESEQPGSSTITVNAVHIILGGLFGSGDIIIAQSRCGVVGPNVNTTTTTSTTSTTVPPTTSTSTTTSTTLAPTTSTTSTTLAPTTSTTSTTLAPTTTTTLKKCNSGSGNGSEPPIPPECDPGGSPGHNKGGD